MTRDEMMAALGRLYSITGDDWVVEMSHCLTELGGAAEQQRRSSLLFRPPAPLGPDAARGAMGCSGALGFHPGPTEKKDGESCLFVAEGGERLRLLPLSVWPLGGCCLPLPELSVALTPSADS